MRIARQVEKLAEIPWPVVFGLLAFPALDAFRNGL
jgi:hypothetical protein